MRGFINSETLTGIANAIRAKTGDTATLAPGAMAAAIAALPEGAGAREFVENGFPQVAPWNDDGVWNDPELKKIGIRLQYLDVPASVNLPNVTQFTDSFIFSGTSVAHATFDKLLKVTDHSFKNCKSLKDISIPAATYLDTEAFYGCNQLKTINLPNVELIYGGNSITSCCFYNCTALTTVRIGKKCTMGSATLYQVFTKCTNLTDIYVPWSEGEVEGAPWGAPNATIHYDTPYTEV